MLLISHARSTSNLVVRMLFSKQSGTVSGEYCFGLGVIDAREAVYAKPLEDFDDTEKEHSFGVYQASASKLQALSAVAENEVSICESLTATLSAVTANRLYSVFSLC